MRRLCLGLMLVTACSKAPVVADPDMTPDLRTRKSGSDWPIFLGPTQNSVSTEKGILTAWPKDGLKVLWETEMGMGFAPPVIGKGRLYHFDRFGDQMRLTCRTAETGKLQWKFEYPTDYVDLYRYSPGPRACPTLDDDRVYIIGPEGMLYCLNALTGKEIWNVNTTKDYHVHQNFFGVGSVPVVEGELLIVPIGGSPKGARPNDLRLAQGDGTGIVAFDKKTGVEKYRISDELASYSSPLLATLDNRRWCFYFARGGLLGFEPASGKIDFHYKWRAKSLESVNASRPILVGDKVLISECYEKGSAVLKVKAGAKPEEIWTDDANDRREKALMCHWNTPIHVDGYVYGSSGRHEDEAELRCIELATGKIMWSQKRLSRSSLLMIEGHFLCLTEDGKLLLLKINPKKFEEVARWDTNLTQPSWPAPIVSHGLLYIRGDDRLICAELIPEKK
jgi:outer membrane protein assembly factor BamB